MATGPLTQVSDIIVPEIFADYLQQETQQKSRLIQSGILEVSPALTAKLGGGGLTFNVPSFQDLDDDDDNVSTDAVADRVGMTAGNPFGTMSAFDAAMGNDSVPAKIETGLEIAVRLSRNKSWSSASLASQLAGADPIQAITSRMSKYWDRKLQKVLIAIYQGISKDNGAEDAGDYANDISGSTFVDGVTNFSSEAFIDAKATMGDSADQLTGIMVHSLVYARMLKNNLIDFRPDASTPDGIATFMNAEIIQDDGVPTGTDAVLGDGTAGEAGVFESWLFGRGQSQFGVGSPDVAMEVERLPSAGNGGGQDVVHSRVEWSIHPTGHAYIGTAPPGGPGNGTAANNLNNAASWNRVYPERKMIRFARLVTRES